MINRILIRIKVVQLLYSYLLLEKHFMIESQPTPPTKEKRYAYSLYLDALVLAVKIARDIEKRGGEKPLMSNRFITRLLDDEKIKSLLLKYDNNTFPFGKILPELTVKIKDSGIYKNYLKQKGNESSGAADVNFWKDIFNIIIFPDEHFNEACTGIENYSIRGVERMKELMEFTFTNYLTSYSNLSDALKALEKSLMKARELYFMLLTLPIEITSLRAQQIDENRHKYLRTNEDVNPNMRFVDNQLVTLLEQNPRITEFVEDHKLNWLPGDHILLNSLLKQIMESDLYKDYMDFPVSDLHTDCEFWRSVFKTIIFRNENFIENLEDKSVYWNDDIDIIGTFVLKTLKRFDESNGEDVVMDMYKDEEDRQFGPTLFTDVVKNQDTLRGYIDETLNKSNWETDRLAFMDIVVCMTAIAEILNFPKIPLQVSVNEYIEIAKAYSTAQSGNFVHGLIGAIVSRLQEQKLLLKTQ